MAKYSKTKCEEARRLYLTGEATSVAEIARRLRTKAHTIGKWRSEEDWDELRRTIDRQAAEKLVEQLATERVTLNSQHFKLWGVVVSRLFETIQNKGLNLDEIRSLERVSSILEKSQRGQRLARGLSLDGSTEEQIRAQAEADGRALIDTFIEAVKGEVPDERTRDRIARALLEHCPAEAEDESVH